VTRVPVIGLVDSDAAAAELSLVRERAYELRELIVEIALGAGTCHIASSLSIADVLAVLFFGRDYDFAAGRDRFLLSKGHACSALYGTLAMTGVLDRERLVGEYCRDGGAFTGLAERGTPGSEISGGSLGHGLAIAVGTALSDRVDGDLRRTVCLLGDGELNEGSVWEAVMLAAQLRLDKLVAVIDANGLQALGALDDIVGLEPLAAKFESFGWAVRDVDGHDLGALTDALVPAAGKPTCVIARTVKGRGVDFMEDDFRWHYGSLKPDDRERVYEALVRGRAA
jgi:transketolase